MNDRTLLLYSFGDVHLCFDALDAHASRVRGDGSRAHAAQNVPGLRARVHRRITIRAKHVDAPYIYMRVCYAYPRDKRKALAAAVSKFARAQRRPKKVESRLSSERIIKIRDVVAFFVVRVAKKKRTPKRSLFSLSLSSERDERLCLYSLFRDFLCKVETLPKKEKKRKERQKCTYILVDYEL